MKRGRSPENACRNVDDAQHAMEPAATPRAAAWLPSTLAGFVVERLLSQDASTKTFAILGRFEGRPGQAVLRFTRQHFDTREEVLVRQLLTANTTLKETFHNDIYSKFDASVPPPHSLVSLDLTYPATDKHIAKAEDRPWHLVHETPDMYQNKVLPYIKSIPPQRLQWVYNILDKKAEVDRLIGEDPDPDAGFMLQPDQKWDQVTTSQLYCLVLCHRRDIPTLRSLTAAHLPLLKNIREKSAQFVHAKYGVADDQLRLYVHYPPSYYHFHVHVTHVKSYGLGSAVGKAHLLDDIIDNIETCGSDYYQRRTLAVAVNEGDDLWRILSDAA